MSEKPRVAILMLTPTIREARVMRQATTLSKHFRVTVLGMGENPFPGVADAEFVSLPADSKSLPAKLMRRAALYATFLGGLIPAADTLRYRLRKSWRAARAWLLRNPVDVLVAHEPETAALAAEIKAKTGAVTIIDYHEFSPLESDNNRHFMLVKRPHVIRVIRRWGERADGATCVADHFSELYAKEFRMAPPLRLFNSPRRLPDPRPEKFNDGRIHLIHHGACSAARDLDIPVKALKDAPENVVLHFMFHPVDEDYLAELKELAKEVPGRVFFEPAVNYTGILPAIAKYDVGVYSIPGNTFNHRYTIGNKFFDFIAAGLPVITGPNDGTARLTRENEMGWVTEDFSAAALARTLKTLTPENIAAAAAKADVFSRRVNADTEHQKLVGYIEGLLAARLQAKSSTL